MTCTVQIHLTGVPRLEEGFAPADGDRVCPADQSAISQADDMGQKVRVVKYN